MTQARLGAAVAAGWISVAAAVVLLCSPTAGADPDTATSGHSATGQSAAGESDSGKTKSSDTSAGPNAEKPDTAQNAVSDNADAGVSPGKDSTADETTGKTPESRPDSEDTAAEPDEDTAAEPDEEAVEPVRRSSAATSTHTSSVSTPAADTDTDTDTDSDAATAATAKVSAATVKTPVGDSPSSSRPPTLADAIGSVVLNVLGGLIQLAVGPPVLPPGSTVSVHSSTLTIPVAGGRTVDADWYFPQNADESTRLIYLQHGFLATGTMYSYTAARLAEGTNSIVVAPTLSSNFFDPDAAWVGGLPMQQAVADLFVGDRAALSQSACAALGTDVTLPQKFVLVGHSAGGTLVTSAAGYLADNGAIDNLLGVVMLDGVEPAGSPAIGNALAKLTGANDRPIYLISSQRYFWSRGGDMADKLSAARPDRFNGVGLEGGFHIDYLQGGNPLIQTAEYLTAGFSSPANIAAASQISIGWINDLFSGTHNDGVYGSDGQQIPIATGDGTATAVVLPLFPAQRSAWDQLLDGFFTMIFDWGGRNVFVYQPYKNSETARRSSICEEGRTTCGLAATGV